MINGLWSFKKTSVKRLINMLRKLNMESHKIVLDKVERTKYTYFESAPNLIVIINFIDSHSGRFERLFNLAR